MNRPNPIDFKVHGATKFFLLSSPSTPQEVHIHNFHNIHKSTNNTTGIKCGCVYI